MGKLLILLGHICVGLGAIGIVLPLVPTTPFLLLAAACYARGSERFYNWLLNNKYFGQYIRDYREGKGIPLKAKITAIILIWVTIGISAIFFIPLLPVQILLFVIAGVITAYLLRLPTKKSDPTPQIDNSERDVRDLTSERIS